MGSRLESKSAQVRKRIENHTFNDEDGEEYEGSKFGGFTDYFRRKKIKLQNLDAELRAKSTGNPPIFRGIVAQINGYTQPSLNDLHDMIVSHGGGFLQYLDGKTMVTHIIASNLTPKKAVEFRRYRIVKPAWIVDSVKAGKLLPWDSYRLLDEGAGQRVLGFDNGQVVSQANKQSKGYKEQSDTSWYTSQLRARQSPPGPSKPQMFTQTLTPNDDDIHDSDFEGLEEGTELQDPRSEQTRSSVEFNVHPPDSDVIDEDIFPRTPPHTSQAVSWNARAVNTAQIEDDLENDLENDLEDTTEDLIAENDDSKVTKRAHSHGSMSPRKVAKLTAEEHNTILLADPRIRKSTVVNPDFLEQYYRESRLHHLSTWKADLKAQLQALTAEKSLSQKKRQKRAPGARRYIMHVDFDSFFAAVSLKRLPEYKDKPAVVAHGGGSGSEIASCNYPARKFGVSNGMWMKRAKELCPDLKVLPYDFPAYEEASRKFYDAILDTGGLVQSVSIDEALVDISVQCISIGGTDGVRRSEGSNFREQAQADEIARELRDKVLQLTGCNVSIGIGANILQAKVALRKAKPAGQFQLKSEDVLEFIGKLEVQSLPGVAYSIGGKLEEIGIKLVKDIRDFSRERLVSTLGPKTGEKIWDYARGIDRTEVGDQVIRKSVSAEVNWGVRFENQEQVDEFIESLCGELCKRLLKENVKGRQLTLKVMRRSPDAPLDPPKNLGHGKCDTYNKSLQLGLATNDGAVITKETLAIMRGFNLSPGELRGIGIQMTKLEPLKAGPDGRPEGSQQRLQFKIGDSIKAKVDASEDPITDDIETPKKLRFRDAAPPTGLIDNDSPSRRPLNIMGTQFALPTQVDPSVLAELPDDIRARLIRRVHPTSANNQRSPSPAARPPSRQTSRMQSPAVNLPNESQLDPETLNALPEDVRRDVLAMYQRSPRKVREQSLLPQSPRKNRTLPPTRKPLVRKRGGGGLFGRNRMGNDNSTLTQANFVAGPRRPSPDGANTTDGEGETGPPAVDPDFLAALPEELRQEVLDQQRSERLRRTGGIDLSANARNRTRKQAQKGQPQQEAMERLFKLPPRPARPTFTVRRLSKMGDLREAMKAWVREFGDEKPYEEDVIALITYLAAVIGDEGDMAKAAKIVKWLGWVVEQGVEGGQQSEQIKQAWTHTVKRIKDGVQEAVKKRGLGELDLG